MVSACCRQDRTGLFTPKKAGFFFFLGNGETPILSCGEKLAGCVWDGAARGHPGGRQLSSLLPSWSGAVVCWGQPWFLGRGTVTRADTLKMPQS